VELPQISDRARRDAGRRLRQQGEARRARTGTGDRSGATQELTRIRIRAGRRDDVDALVALEQACFRTDRFSRRAFDWLLTRAFADVLCLTVDGNVVGCAIVVYRTGLTGARLYTLAVAPQLQGNGLGTRLLAAAERAAKRRGRTALRLEVRLRNRAARAMYERRGYRPIARVDPYYEDGSPALRLERDLNPRARARTPALQPAPPLRF
jgi:ribosomal protein S18 acetylase RimI-like enzyme